MDIFHKLIPKLASVYKKLYIQVVYFLVPEQKM